MSDSLSPHELQLTRPPCPSPTPGVYPNSSPLSRWCRSTILDDNLCRPLLLLPLVFPSIRVFSNLSVLRIRWPKYWSFSFSISPSNKYSELISFKIDWLDLLAVQGTLNSLHQHHISSSAPSILQCSAFFMVHLSWRKYILLSHIPNLSILSFYLRCSWDLEKSLHAMRDPLGSSF